MAPSTAISVAPTFGTSGQTSGAISVSWACFTSAAGTAGLFGAACPTPRVTSSRILPRGGAAISAPGVPSNLSGTVSGSVVTLNWSAPAGGDAPTSYLLQAGTAAGLSDITSFDTGSAATSLAVFNVPAGTYFVRVRAVNAGGTSAASNEFQLVVSGAPPCGTLLPPTGVAATVSGSTLVLTWTAPTGCAPTTYIIQAGSAPGLSNLANFSTGSTATSFTATGLPAGTYYVRIQSAATGVLSTSSTEVSFTVGSCATVPNAPANLRAAVSGTTITLAWDAPTGGCAPSSYLLQVGSTPGASDLANAVVNGTSLIATNVANGTYYIRIRAVNAVGQSAASNEVAVTVGSGTPPSTLVASFQFFDPATQSGATTACRIASRASPPQPTTCILRSTSFTLGPTTILYYTWNVQYTFDGAVKTIIGDTPSIQFSETCGNLSSTADGAAQPVQVTLTVTDSAGVVATATSGSGSQPALQLRLYTCGI